MMTVLLEPFPVQGELHRAPSRLSTMLLPRGTVGSVRPCSWAGQGRNRHPAGKETSRMITRRWAVLAAMPVAVAGLTMGLGRAGAQTAAGTPVPVHVLLCGTFAPGSDRFS